MKTELSALLQFCPVITKRNAKQNSYIKLIQESGSAIVGGTLPIPSPELQAAVVKAAHKHGKIALAHALSQHETLLVLDAGVDGLAHCFSDEPPTEVLVDAYRKNNSFLVPTLTVIATQTGEEDKSYQEHVEHPLVAKELDDAGKTCFCQKLMLAREGCTIENSYQAVRKLKEAGLDIVA